MYIIMPLVKQHLLCSSLLAFLTLVTGSLNKLDGPLKFKCQHEYQFINRVSSTHNNPTEDRTFDLYCSDIDVHVENLNTSCSWTDWQNDFDGLLAFECSGNGYINGMKSYHDNIAEDRKWAFHCCEINEIHLFDCELTDWTNDLDGVQNYKLPAQRVMKGVVSVHDNNSEDRRYKYEICQVAWGNIGSLFG